MRKAKYPIIIAIILILCFALALLAEIGGAFLEKKLHPIKYAELVEKYSVEYNIPEYVVYAVIDVESNFEPYASSGLADGLMQIAPKTFEWLSSDEHLGENLPAEAVFDEDVNIRYGCYYLRYLHNKFKNWNTVFAAYNGGEGNVSEWLMNRKYSDENGNLTNIPFHETANYVKKVNYSIDYYKEIYYNKQTEVKS